jgi:hypothetical protein
VQIPILNGIKTDPARPDFRNAYPLNMVPVPKAQGISEGYLRPAEGIVTLNASTPGADRGGVVWNGVGYRVMGTKLCRVNLAGAITVLGDVGGSGPVLMDYSFDRLGFASGGFLWYCMGGAPFAVADIDIGLVNDAMFIGGYWMTTDGESIVVTEIADPLAVNPLRYGSSEVDPDPIIALKRVREEVYAINRYSIEGFRNIGGLGFPFQVIQGAQVMRGAVGRAAVCLFEEGVLAFVGGGRNEGVSVYLSENGNSLSIASREVEQILEEFSDAELANIVLESRLLRSHKFLYMHLPDRTLVYDAMASAVVEEPAWHVLASGLEPSQFQVRGFMLLNNQWVAGDPTGPRFGALSDKLMEHWGEPVAWEFSVPVLYNDGNPVILHELELVALSGRVELGDDPVIWTSRSADGYGWGAERSVKAGKIGDSLKRLVWLGQGMVSNWCVQRFRGTGDARLAFARLEARVEPLNRKRGNGA